MPSHQDRREPLPKGYRFGDARTTQAGRVGALEPWIVKEYERLATMALCPQSTATVFK